MIAVPDKPDIFEVPKDDLPEHYAAIGRLITAFSNIERALNDVIRAVIGKNVGAGLSEEMSRALIGEMRATDLIAQLRRLLEARERDAFVVSDVRPPKPNGMEPLFKEIQELKPVRDRVAHHRFFVRERGMIFTNADTARSTPAAQFNLYSVEELNEIAKYAGRLTARVYLLRPALFLASADMTRDPALLEIPARLQSANRSRKTRRGRQRQRQSSPP